MTIPTDTNGKPVHVGDRVRSLLTDRCGRVTRTNTGGGCDGTVGLIYDDDTCEILALSVRIEILAAPVLGPYEEERQAYADAPYRDSENAKERRNGCAELLRGICREAGVELGDYDEEIVRLLSRLGPEVVQSVAGMISRAGAR